MVRLLDGVKVFEVGIAIASPNAGRLLAHHGAEVYKIESPTSPDIVRLIGSAWLRDNEELAPVIPDSSPYVSEMNADKKSVALDLKEPEARAAASRLLAECDVFLANIGARALAELGLDYDSVTELRPDIVYVQLPGFGSDPEAPYYPFVAWGPNQAPLVGIDDLTGHADQEPAGIATVAPPDYLSSLHAAFCTLTGLEQRDRTGEGVHVDVSQFETTVSLLLGPYVMDHALTGRTQSRVGNRSLWYAPEGVYPCRGEERWIAISVEDDEMWEGLLSLGPVEWADDERFATNEARLANADVLDEAIAAWTVGFTNTDLATRLQGVGVAAHVVATNEDILQDSHVMESGWYQARPSSRFTRDLFSGYPIRMSETPGSWERAGPSSGEHTVEVLTGVAGMSEDEVAKLIDDGLAFTMDHPDLRVDRPYENWLHVLFPHDAPDTRDL
ncbi:MAG: CoA transferase [Acidimicrobiia bacterium]|nr:CoA transferase [Acidimicrobiia bacterium]